MACLRMLYSYIRTPFPRHWLPIAGLKFRTRIPRNQFSSIAPLGLEQGHPKINIHDQHSIFSDSALRGLGGCTQVVYGHGRMTIDRGGVDCTNTSDTLSRG